MAHVKKISEGKYLIRVSKGTGKSRQWHNYTFRGTLAKAREYAREKETLIDQGVALESAFTFEKYFRLWLKAVKPKLAPRTYDGYEGYIERYALTRLGGLKLSDIKRHHIQTIYIETQKSPTTIRNLHAALNACFNYAVTRDFLRINPCKNVDLPAKEKREMTVLTPEEAAKFTQVCSGMPNGLIFLLALETGMRPEEYLALRWSDLSENDISVQQVVQFNRKGGGYYFARPKTARSRRRIAISDSLRQRLREHRRAQNEHRLKIKTWFNNDLIFPNIIGQPIPLPNLTRRYFKPILDKCGFDKHIKLYSLRHSCATLLMMAGYNAKIVADRLGHASTVMTMDVYSHVLPHMQEEATGALENIMRFKR